MKKLLYILVFVPLVLFGQAYSIGDSLQGGVLFHINEGEGYGLVAATYDLPLGYEWGIVGEDIGGTEMGVGAGEQNTEVLLSTYFSPSFISQGVVQGGDIPIISAAEACNEYSVESFSDWYLPSINELILLYQNGNLNADANQNFFSNESWYWSSTEFDPHHAYGLNHTVDPQGVGEFVSSRSKFDVLRVKPIRKFSLVYGCTDSLFVEFSPEATLNDGSCQVSLTQFYMEMVDSIEFAYQNLLDESTVLQNDFNVLESEAITSLSSLQQALDTWNTKIDLDEGWNMFGFGCPEAINLIDGVSNYSESIMIVKDDWGLAYLPEYGFNGIGDLTPGAGYQIKLSQAIDDFSLCDWYVNDIPEDNVVSLQEEVVELQVFNDSLEEFIIDLQEEMSFMSPFFGCMDESACNYDETALVSDGSCTYPEGGYDCNGNNLPMIGDFFAGGIVFKVNSVNGTGWVAATEDFTGNMDYWEAHAVVENSTLEGYDDWERPPLDLLEEMYYSIGQGSNNVGGFSDSWYWSSSDCSSLGHWICAFDFANGTNYYPGVTSSGKVRAVRAF